MLALAGVSIEDDYTPGELVIMAKARDRALWGHTSTVCALVANVMRSGKAAKPSDYNPYAPRAEKPKYNHADMCRILREKKSNGTSISK